MCWLPGAGDQVFEINDHGIGTGSWLDVSGVEHGYFGDPDGAGYTTFDDPTEPGTEPRGINDSGAILGFDNSQNHSPESYIPFERAPDGTITNVTMGGATLNNIVQGINRRSEFTGSYYNTSLNVVAYVGKNAAFSEGHQAEGYREYGRRRTRINAAGDVVGWYTDSNGVEHGFLLSGGNATTIDYSGAAYTVLEGINDKGTISGYYGDKSGIIHGFTYDIATKAFEEIKVPTAKSFVQAWGINNKGWVAIASDAGNYVYCPSDRHCVGAPPCSGRRCRNCTRSFPERVALFWPGTATRWFQPLRSHSLHLRINRDTVARSSGRAIRAPLLRPRPIRSSCGAFLDSGPFCGDGGIE